MGIKSYPACVATVIILITNIITAFAKDYSAALFSIITGGTVLNTRSIQFGIDYISQNGGGRLVFPAGIYLTGAIHIKSDVTLQLNENAILLGSVNPFDYDRQNTPFDRSYKTCLALILGLNQHNIGIAGKGTIDGQGKELAANVGELIKKGFIKGGAVSRPNEDNRPMIISFFGCEQVEIKDITLKNAACWVECYNQCKNVNVDSIRVDSRAFWNNDGIDIVDCNNFRVSNSYFNSSDDGICLKSLSTDLLNQNIWIQNNSMTTEASGIKFGTASYGGFKDIHILNNKVFDTYRSALALEAVDGAVIENIIVDGLQGTNNGNGIFLRAGVRTGARKSQVSNVNIQNVNVSLRAEKNPSKVLPGIVIAGWSGQPITHITFKNIIIKLPGGAEDAMAKISIANVADVKENDGGYPEVSMFGDLPSWGVYIRHAENIQFNSLDLQALKIDFRTAIVLDDAHKVEFKKLKVKDPGNKKTIFTYKSSEITPK